MRKGNDREEHRCLRVVQLKRVLRNTPGYHAPTRHKQRTETRTRHNWAPAPRTAESMPGFGGGRRISTLSNLNSRALCGAPPSVILAASANDEWEANEEDRSKEESDEPSDVELDDIS